MTQFNFPYCFLDIETTGFHPGTCEIIEVYIEDSDGNELEQLIRPASGVPGEIKDLTGITNEMLLGKPAIADVIDKIHDFIAGKLVIAHNATFDLSFLAYEIWRHKKLVPKIHFFCTLKAAKKLVSARSYALGKLAKQLSYTDEVGHRAKGDVQALKFVAGKLLSLISPNDKLDLERFVGCGYADRYVFDVLNASEQPSKARFSPKYVDLGKWIVLEFSYKKAKGGSGNYRLNVKKLAECNGQKYLFGTCQESEEEKHFRLDRIIGDVYDVTEDEMVTVKELFEYLSGRNSESCDPENKFVYESQSFEEDDEPIATKSCEFSSEQLREIGLNQDVSEVKRFLVDLSDIDAADEDGKTILMHASKANRNPEVIRAIIEAGAEVDAIDNFGNTALRLAALENTEVEVFKVLLEAGADANHKNHEGKTPLSGAATSNSNAEVIKILIEAGADINIRVNNNMTVLMVAASCNPASEVARALVESGCGIDYTNDEGVTALMFAAENNNNDMVSFLIESGAKIETKDRSGMTALMHAAKCNINPGVIEKFIEAGANVNAENNDGWTALIHAVTKNSISDVSALLAAGANASVIIDSGHSSILTIAALFDCNLEIMAALIKSGAADIENAVMAQGFLNKVGGYYGFVWEKSNLRNLEVRSVFLEAALNIIEPNGNSLFAAIASNSLEMLKQALIDGAKVDSKNAFGITPLMSAARNNTGIEIIRFLIQAGADVNQRDDRGLTPLMFASSNNDHPEVLSELLKNGADVNAISGNGITPLMFAASNNTNLEVTKLLLDSGAEVNAYARDCVVTAIFFAAGNNSNSDILSELIKAGAKDFDFPLFNAAMRCKNPEIVRTLVRLGAEVDSRIAYEQTGLMIAVIFQQTPEVINAFLESGADINARDDRGSTALNLALGFGCDLETIKLLVDAGADINIRDEDGSSIGAALSRPDWDEILEIFSLGDAISVRDDEGWTLLLHASKHASNPKVIRALIEAGSDLNARTLTGLSPLMLAAQFNSCEVVSTLISAGLLLESKDANGWTALMYAAAYNDFPYVLLALIEAGADVNSKDFTGKTALMHASQSNPEPKIIRALVDAGADIGMRDNDGWNALMLAAAYSPCAEVIAVLIDSGSDVNELDSDGWSALMIAAAKNDCPEVIMPLLNAGADARLKNSDGQTAFDLASENEDIKGTPAYWKLNDARFSDKPQDGVVKNASIKQLSTGQVISLSDGIAKRIASLSPKGDGGFQRLIKMLQENLDGNHLKLDSKQIQRVERYAAKYGKGGYQQVFKAILTALNK